MKTPRFLLLFSFIALFPITNTLADTSQSEFMTSRDLMSNGALSNINLHNNQNATANVYGLYVRQFAYVTPGQSCANATVIYSTTQNTTAGAVVMPVPVPAGKSAAIGSNYLYNMIYTANYYINVLFSTPPGTCALPGCTWGSDSTKYNWCIYLGALAPVTTTSGYTSTVPPAADLASSAGNYNYNLINNYVMLGPISCNDQTLTCTVANQQTQSFP